MQGTSLRGLTILVVEDEPLIALDIAAALGRAGAEVRAASSIGLALVTVEDPVLSAAVLDHLPDDGGYRLHARLTALGIPHLVYSGYPDAAGIWRDSPFLSKPATPAELVAAVEGLLSASPAQDTAPS